MPISLHAVSKRSVRHIVDRMDVGVGAAIILTLPSNLQKTTTVSIKLKKRIPNKSSRAKGRRKENKKKRTHNLLPKISFADCPPLTLPTNRQKEPIRQAQVSFGLLLRLKLQILARPYARTIILELSHAMRTRGFGLEGAVGGEVELREGVVAGADEAEEVGCLGEGVEEGG